MTDAEMIAYIGALQASGAVGRFHVVSRVDGTVDHIVVQPIPALKMLSPEECTKAMELLMTPAEGSA